ncbi:MAG: prepilin-type N-terminal cleavage/methylation domain-containing protein [bacterium]
MSIKLNNQGMSLLEVLVAMAIFSLIMLGVVAMLSFSFKANKIIWEQLSTQNEGRKIVQDFINELRSATYSSIGAYPLETVGDQEIIFYSNIDDDSLRERVRYFLTGSTLKKGVTKPTGIPLSYNTSTETIIEIVHDVYNTTTPIFYYYDQNYGYTSSTPLSQPVAMTNVKMVSFILELEEDPTASPEPFHIETKTEIRNLKTN